MMMWSNVRFLIGKSCIVSSTKNIHVECSDCGGSSITRNKKRKAEIVLDFDKQQLHHIQQCIPLPTVPVEFAEPDSALLVGKSSFFSIFLIFDISAVSLEKHDPATLQISRSHSLRTVLVQMGFVRKLNQKYSYEEMFKKSDLNSKEKVQRKEELSQELRVVASKARTQLEDIFTTEKTIECESLKHNIWGKRQLQMTILQSSKRLDHKLRFRRLKSYVNQATCFVDLFLRPARPPLRCFKSVVLVWVSLGVLEVEKLG